MNLTHLYAALIGSAITLISVFLTKVFDLIQKAREHKYALRQMLFERKLQSAEAAMGKYYESASSIGALATLYQEVSTESKEMDFDFMQYMNKSLTESINKVTKSANEVSNTIFLYFDIGKDDPAFNYDLFRKFLTCLSRMAFHTKKMNFAMEYYTKYRDTKNQEFAWRKVEEALDEAKPSIKELSELLNEIKESMMNILEKIREEISEFQV